MFSTDQYTHKDRLGEYSQLHIFHYIRNYGATNEREANIGTSDASDHMLSIEASGLAKVPSSPRSNKKKLGLAALVVLIYYEVSGGPFGIEDIVRAGGPLYAILGFSLFLIWVIPEALVTAELSTALPEASGAVGK
jgi:hypothetical protein